MRRSLMLLLFPLLLAHGAQADPGGISAADAVSIIREAKVINVKYSLRAIITGDQATILTRRNAKSPINDSKIDAVLITKALCDAYGTGISKCNVLFSTDDNPQIYSQISVDATDVRSFGSGKVTEAQLLQSLSVTQVDGASLATPQQSDASEALVPGPFMEERLLLIDQIQSLKSKGTGVQPFEQLMAQIEETTKKGDRDGARAQIAGLSSKLKEQLEFVKQAQQTSKYASAGKLTTVQPGSDGPAAFRRRQRMERRYNPQAEPVSSPPQGAPRRPNSPEQGGDPPSVPTSHPEAMQRRNQIMSALESASPQKRGNLMQEMSRVQTLCDQNNLDAAEKLIRHIEDQLHLPPKYRNYLPYPGH